MNDEKVHVLTNEEIESLAYSAITDLNSLRTEFEAFKANVIRQVVHWPHGCEQGKRDFLQSCDLELPQETFTLSVTVHTEYGQDLDDIYTLLDERLKDSGFVLGDIRSEGTLYV